MSGGFKHLKSADGADYLTLGGDDIAGTNALVQWPPPFLVGQTAKMAGTTTTGPGTTSAAMTATGTSSASPFVINITWDASVQSAPSVFVPGVLTAVQYLESMFRDPVTINIDVGYGEVGGSVLPKSALGESLWYLTSVDYASLAGALDADATTATDATAVASLPAASPVSGTFWTTTAQAKALGFISGTDPSLDGYVGFSGTDGFTYNDSGGVASGTYDFEAVALHEISEVMGRDLLTGSTLSGISSSYSIADLFHYSSLRQPARMRSMRSPPPA